MTDPAPTPHNDEQQLAELLRTVDHDLPSADAPTLDALRAATLQAFAETNSHRESEMNTTTHAALADSPASPSSTSSASSGFAMKLVTALIAIVLVTLGVWFSGNPSRAAAPELREVLAKLDAADVLQLQVTRDGTTANVWVKQPGLVRWEESPARYRIARGSRLWQVYEDADTSSSDELVGDAVSTDNPWFGSDGRIDLLALLDVDTGSQPAALLQAVPTGTATYAGKACHRYRHMMTSASGQYRLDVFVDRDTEQLVGITAHNLTLDVDGMPPVAELTLIALNAPVDEEKFRVPVKLAESDRIGKVTDAQGIVTLRPVGSRRWTPVCRQLLVQPGDWIRTDVRGANAATVELTSQVTLTVGPATLLEVVTSTEARLHAGTVQVARTKQSAGDFRLTGAQDDDTMTFTDAGKQLIQLDRADSLTKVKGKPVWLAGYDGTSAEDSIGSLIVNVDGREQSLSVGEHHVTVEIRDQIARTTIEETFVNHTNSRLEGQFHFPLPPDASISGFGMWIGGELIEADIVEKQRAREIYETILREKRDPGLLEWTGGNIFKARVFPIEAHSEKRIKIVYTQVLPLRGNRFRYNYALKSEMLQTNPLRELNIRVLLSSAVPLAEVTSTTHTCRTQQTKHSAELEFTAQEYTPTRDFEVVCEVNHRENDLLIIPHRRGDDGYFLMQLMPPGTEGQWTREVIPDGDPLDVILLCDTSGSMDSDMRKTQAEFVSTLLTSLGDKDRFTLATTDVNTHWAFPRFVTADEDHITQARDFLDTRVSLGWTDLDRAFAAVLKKAKPGCQIIYVGDGIVTTIESDPSAFVGRLKLLNTQENSTKNPATFHAVSVGSSYESVVLKGIASLGGGSVRQISGETTPQETALELLNEIAQPGLKNVNVEFRGLRVAAVYPEQLPNIAAGTQQILVGRYLPQGERQSGEVVVTGTLNDQPVKYVAQIELANAESGNSFIPRLWARGRLDALLQEGATQLIQNEIIGLSEEFHIITPYTSLLVLETDADRERFGVKRRFGMRDGERFFADGRDNANYELRQQQMQRAGNWRLGLRRQLLAQLSNFGRDASVFAAAKQKHLEDLDTLVSSFSSSLSAPALSKDLTRLGLANGTQLDMPTVTWDTNGEAFLGDIRRESLIGRGLEQFVSDKEYSSRSDAWADSKVFSLYTGIDRRRERKPAEGSAGTRFLLADEITWDDRLSTLAGLERPERSKALREELKSLDGLALYAPPTVGRTKFEESLDELALGIDFIGPEVSRSDGDLLSDHWVLGFEFYRGQSAARGSHRSDPWQSLRWINTYFPALPDAPLDPPEATQTDSPATNWPAEAVAISDSLLRIDALRKLSGGIEIERVTSSYHGSFRRLKPSGHRWELWSPERWLTRDGGQGQHPLVNWLDQEQRGVYSEAFLLGRVRGSVETEFDAVPLQMSDHSLTPLTQTYRNYRVTVEKPAKNRVVLRCVYLHNTDHEVRFTIDTARHVLLKQENFSEGKATSTTTHSQFVEVAGLWWATKIETSTAAHPERMTSRITQTITALEDERFAEAYQSHKSLAERTCFLTAPRPTVRQAKQAVAAGTATEQERFTLVLHYCLNQKWPEAFEQLRAWETLVKKSSDAAKPGAAWVRIAVELVAARHEDARQRLVQQLEAIVAAKLPQANFPPTWEGGDLFLTTHTLSQLYPVLGWHAYGEVIERTKPVFSRQQDPAVAMHDWDTRWLQVLDSLGRVEDALAKQHEMLTDVPGDVYIRTRYAGRLNNLGRTEEALGFLKQELAKNDHWEHSEANALRFSYADILDGHGRDEEVLNFYQEWLPKETTQSKLFARYLSALVMNDRTDTADETVQNWLKLAEQAGSLEAADLGKVNAAVRFCFGRAHNLSRYYGMERRWLPSLYATAHHCLTRDDRLNIIRAIAQDSHFSQSDVGDRLRGDILHLLLKAVNQPAKRIKADEANARQAHLQLPIEHERLQLLIDLLRNGRLLIGSEDDIQIRQVTAAEWAAIADALFKWWNDTPQDLQKHKLSSLLTSLYSHQLKERQLPFLRRRVAEGAEKHLASYRQELYNTLLTQPWSLEIEAELFALWPTLAPVETVNAEGKKIPVLDSIRTMQLVPKLYQLVDTMLKNRIASAQRALQDQGKVDAATRSERAKSAAQIVQEARKGLAERLQNEWEARGLNETLLPHWIMAEKIYLDMLLERNQADVLQWAWGELGEAPPEFTPPLEKNDDAVQVEDHPKPTPRQLADRLVTKKLNRLLKQRAWATVMNLAARRASDPKLVDRVLDYIDSGIASGEAATDFVNEKLKAAGAHADELVDFTLGWRRAKYQALIVFDRPDELVTALKAWIIQDQWSIPWRRALAKLYAERGEIKAAIEQMEFIERDDELTPQDYAALANWHLVLDNRKVYERSRIKTYKSMQEWQLNQALNQTYNRLNRGNGLHELDETTLFMLQALFEKTNNPGNYYSHLHSFYTVTRDFRLLKMLPESMLGRTQSAVYSALSNTLKYLIQEVRKEATADEILEHVHYLRERIHNGWVPRGADQNARSLALDLRALDLLESMIERKASEVLNQPGPHAKAVLTTFQRAFRQDWQTGERLQYAQFLQKIGAVTHERSHPQLTPLADEQLRQMQQLYDDSEPGTNDRVRIGLAQAQLLFYGYSRHQAGLIIFESALMEFAVAHDGPIPYSHRDLVIAYSHMLQHRKQFLRAEQYVQQQLDALENEGQRWVYVSHLNELHAAALYDGSRTSLGSKTMLMDNLLARLIQQCDTNDDHRRYQVLYLIGNVFENVCGQQDNSIPSVRPKLLKFANTALQELLANQRSNYAGIVQRFANIIHNRINALEAFAFLLDRLEDYPPRFEYGSQAGWQQHGWSLAECRHEGARLTQPQGKLSNQRQRFEALEARLLPVVLAELRSDLVNLRSRNHAFYYNDHSYFWAAKAGEFLDVAEDVLQEHQNSPRTITYVAEYLYRGLDQFSRAIEVLFIAERRGLLDDDGQLQLVRYLHERNRHAESIALLEPLLDRRQNEMHLRVLLTRAYYHADRKQQLAEFTQATDAHFHEGGRWVENNIIQFARVLAETGQDQQAAESFEEAISLHQNTDPNRGIGTGTLSAYYQEVATVYSRLGQDDKAIDAAAGGVVSWGNHQDKRKDALERLKATIASVKNLDEYIQSLDQQAKRTGEDSPLLRKMVAAVLQQRDQYAAAIAQYRISLELQPDDRDVHQWLLECYDRLDDNAGAIQQLLAQLDFDRHNLDLHKSLAKRTEADSLLAERAATSIIEQAPSDAESYQALAGFRQEQDRWEEAIPLWKRVAELRKREPTGLLGLAKAQLHEGDVAAAKETLDQLRRKTWPEHFGDVHEQVRELEKQLKP